VQNVPTEEATKMSPMVEVFSAISAPGLQSPIEQPTHSLSALMPRPGQPGSLDVFTGNDISNYRDDYNAECELYNVRPDHRFIRFPRYCTPEIKEIVMLLPGYEPRDWDLLQAELKRFH
jgi:hypothetical protein